MQVSKLKQKIPPKVFALLEKKGFNTLRPSQVKSIDAGLFDDENLLVCTPTASGKTLVAELAALNGIIHDHGKALYVVPLRALANEKHKQFTKAYPGINIGMSSGDIDSADTHLERYDLIVLTSEKLDSLLRHHAPWLKTVKTVVFDEVHLLNDPNRGPTLEVVIAILRKLLPHLQLIALSATIGNPEELAQWLDATLVKDDWRPVTLHKGVYHNSNITYEE
ncbi:DEAD/DEAH box helicase [Candidatus Woesearchaeota archaeon]|nr:DEAD/DEAH box helicase [Candidatus Woesearchaeota archaeon]